jgi:hypothetical protein
MPFTCTIVVPGSGSAEQAAVRFLAREGALMERGDAIFLLTRDGQTQIYEIAMSCVLTEKLVEDGSAVPAEQPVAFAEVDGDDIPYGQPFVVERRDVMLSERAPAIART